MRKNILTIIILAATMVNLTLTAMIIFTFVPYMKNANDLVVKISQIADLELETPEATAEAATYTLADLITQEVLTEEVANLKTDDSGKVSYAEVTAEISINKNDEYYISNPDIVNVHSTEVERYILDEIGKYTGDTVSDNIDSIEADALASIQEFFGSQFIVKVTVKILVQH